MKVKPELWIGLVELKPLAKEKGKPAGSFTNIVTWATDTDSYRSKVEVIAAKLEMYIAEIENPEPIQIRYRDADMKEEVEDMVLRAENNPKAIIYGTFHNYPHEIG